MATNKSKSPAKKNDKGETITELAQRHLKDQSHTTSDEELRNAKLELTENFEEDAKNLYKVDNTPVSAKLSDETENDGDNNAKDKDKDDDKGHSPNPYSVLS